MDLRTLAQIQPSANIEDRREESPIISLRDLAAFHGGHPSGMQPLNSSPAKAVSDFLSFNPMEARVASPLAELAGFYNLPNRSFDQIVRDQLKSNAPSVRTSSHTPLDDFTQETELMTAMLGGPRWLTDRQR